MFPKSTFEFKFEFLKWYSKSTTTQWLPSPVAATNSQRLLALILKCLSDTYWLAITYCTIVTLFLDVCTPSPLDQTYVYKMPLFANTPKLMFDLTSVYSSGGLTSCNHGILYNGVKWTWTKTVGTKGLLDWPSGCLDLRSNANNKWRTVSGLFYIQIRNSSSRMWIIKSNNRGLNSE